MQTADQAPSPQNSCHKMVIVFDWSTLTVYPLALSITGRFENKRFVVIGYSTSYRAVMRNTSHHEQLVNPYI